MKSSWRYPICDCFSDPRLCILSFLCPCVQLGRNATYFGEPCFVVASCFCLPYGPIIRHKLRSLRDIRGTMSTDILSYMFLPCCAVLQEAREISIIRNGQAHKRKAAKSLINKKSIHIDTPSEPLTIERTWRWWFFGMASSSYIVLKKWHNSLEKSKFPNVSNTQNAPFTQQCLKHWEIIMFSGNIFLIYYCCFDMYDMNESTVCVSMWWVGIPCYSLSRMILARLFQCYLFAGHTNCGNWSKSPFLPSFNLFLWTKLLSLINKTMNFICLFISNVLAQYIESKLFNE